MERIDTEVAIIGGGIAACSAALHLRRRGIPVTLLEKGFTGASASGVNFGGVRRNGRHLGELPIAERALFHYWRRLKEWVGTDCEYVETGHLKFARNEQDLSELETYAEAARDYGLKLEMIGRRTLLKRYEWIGEDAFAASWSPTDGQANPRLVGPAFARAARAAGADIREQSKAVEALSDGDRFEIRTDNGLLVRARRLINAAGAWGAQIAEMFGEAVPLETITPQMVVTEPVSYFMRPVTGICGGSVYIRQIPRGNIIFGNTGGGVADLDAGLSYVVPERTLETFAHAVKLVPRIAEALVIRVWTGLEGATADGHPVIGPSRTTPGLIHGFGFSGHGFQLSPAVGAILSELAIDGATQMQIAHLDISRFAGRSENSGSGKAHSG